MEQSAGTFQRPPRSRNDKGRRSWSTREEEVLLAAMKEIISQGWKSENGFRPGYLTALEGIMVKELPRTNLKATPHINSRIHTWKKYYSSLFSMLSRTGIGFDHKTKMIDATDEAWDAYEKIDPSARLMRNKSWPFYEDWCEIFGKDRANGAGAEDMNDAVSQPTGQRTSQMGGETDGLDGLFEGYNDEAEETSVCQPPPTTAEQKKTTGRKRKGCSSQDPMSAEVISFCQDASKRLGEIAERIGYEVDLGKARRQIFVFVKRMDGLTLQQKLKTTKLIGKNTEDLEIFSGLDDDAKDEWARMTLEGSL